MYSKKNLTTDMITNKISKIKVKKKANVTLKHIDLKRCLWWLHFTSITSIYFIYNVIGKRSVASGEDNEKDKRLPAGFVGLRGKKPLSSESSSYPIAALYPEETVDKRVPSGFLGVRGKKEEGFEDDGHYGNPIILYIR